MPPDPLEGYVLHTVSAVLNISVCSPEKVSPLSKKKNTLYETPAVLYYFCLLMQTWEILQDVRSADEREDPSHDAIGLHHLLHDNTFTTAYPLHEVSVARSRQERTAGQ